MKTIKEKAKAYDEASKWMENVYPTLSHEQQMEAEAFFPMFKESEDEKIRNLIYCLIRDRSDNGKLLEANGCPIEKALAWLEKQGEHPDRIVEIAKSAKQRVIITESHGDANVDWDARSLQDVKMLLECGLKYINREIEKQSEQKQGANMQINPSEYINDMGGNGCYLKNTNQMPTDKVKPKFKIGDSITPKNKNEHYTITDIVDEWYEFREKHINGGIPVHHQDEWQLVEQKPAEWSEEDEEHIKSLLARLEGMCKPEATFTRTRFAVSEDKDWLKSLKDRVGCEANCTTMWKPSEEQLKALNFLNIAGMITDMDYARQLRLLYEQLKAL